MTFTHQTGVYNVFGSVTAWLRAQIIANQPPAVSSVTIAVEWPEQPVVTPSWSIIWLTQDEDAPYLGHRIDSGAGTRQFGIVEIDCWASRRMANWRVQLAQMVDVVRSAVMTLRASGSTIPVYDFYANADTPAALSYRITIDRVESRTPPFDPNPDIERRRLLMYIEWMERQ